MRHIQTVVSDIQELADGYFELVFPWSAELDAPLPGQFFTVRPSESSVPLLRRPFAYSSYSSGRAACILEQRGPSTQILIGKRQGDPLDVLGPLGNSFPMPQSDRIPVLLCGGIGVGPLFFFADSLKAAERNVVVIVGGRTAAKIPPYPSGDGVSVVVCTDDGSAGFRGTPTEYLRTRSDDLLDSAELYLCGPHGLLQSGHELATERDLPAWVSMEQTMGCAVGACMGCVVRVTGDLPYARVCTEGPVFASRTIQWS